MIQIVTVGVAGGTCSGKTTLCQTLARVLGQVRILDLDSYYLDRSDVPPDRRARLNFDEPAAFDLPLFLQHLAELRKGRSIAKPRYSFEDHTRIGSDIVDPAPLLLVEGLFVLWWEELRPLLDFKVFVDASQDARLARRLKRDGESRGRTSQAILQQYETTVHPMHERYVEPTRTRADLVVSNDRDLLICAKTVHAALLATEPMRQPQRDRHAQSL